MPAVFRVEEARLPRSPMEAPQQVIVRDPGLEIHGYAVAADGEWITVVWMVASGRCRQRRVASEDVYLPSEAHPWRGLAMRPEKLREVHRGTP